MPPPGSARDVARRLFAREMGGETDDAALVAAAERLCTRVSDGLSRWFGPYGSLALVNRALARAQTDHPSLAAVTAAAAPSACLTGLAESARVHGAKATAEGIVAMLAALADMIGRLIGDDLATNLLEQSTTVPSASGTAVAASPAAPVAAPRADPAPPVDPAPADAGTADDVHQTLTEP